MGFIVFINFRENNLRAKYMQMSFLCYRPGWLSIRSGIGKDLIPSYIIGKNI